MDCQLISPWSPFWRITVQSGAEGRAENVSASRGTSLLRLMVPHSIRHLSPDDIQHSLLGGYLLRHRKYNLSGLYK